VAIEPSPTTRDSPSPDDPTSRSRVRAFYELTKPGIAFSAMLTAGVSYYVGAQGSVAWLPVLHTLLGTVLATAGALALNQYLERDVDALMFRTRTRPLPSGRLQPRDALLFGLLLVLGGTVHLWSTVGWLPAALTLASAAGYNLVYTPLKARTYAATFAGAVPGAMPALIGWSAAAGNVDLGALSLFTVAFAWQIPHVLALAWILRDDYARAGFRFSPPSDVDGNTIGRSIAISSAVLVAVSILPWLVGITGGIYLAGAAVLGLLFLSRCFAATREMSRASAREVFLGSLAYQPLLFGLMMIDTIRP